MICMYEMNILYFSYNHISLVYIIVYWLSLLVRLLVHSFTSECQPLHITQNMNHRKLHLNYLLMDARFQQEYQCMVHLPDVWG